MENKEKILFVANTSWYLYNFRLSLAKELKKQNKNLIFVAPRDRYSALLEQEGFSFVEWKLFRRSINPWQELLAFYRLGKIYQKEKPQIVHHFTVKCVLYGSLQAKLKRIPAVFNSITGLGHIFITEQPIKKIIRFFLSIFYRLFVNGANVRFIFQNKDDLYLFQKLKIIKEAKLIRSSGVNLERFCVRTDTNNHAPVVLFASRLLMEKGIVELIEAAKMLRKKGLRFHLRIAGESDKGNPSSIPQQEIDTWILQNDAEFLGHVDGIEKIIEQSDIVVLPSYREGVPKILLEAAAMGKTLLATDVPGCREVVIHEVTGLLAQARSATSLAAMLERLLLDEQLRKKLALAAREKVLKEFDEKIVIAQTCEFYQSLFFLRQA